MQKIPFNLLAFGERPSAQKTVGFRQSK